MYTLLTTLQCVFRPVRISCGFMLLKWTQTAQNFRNTSFTYCEGPTHSYCSLFPQLKVLLIVTSPRQNKMSEGSSVTSESLMAPQEVSLPHFHLSINPL